MTSARGQRYVQLPFGNSQKADNVAILRAKTAYQSERRRGPQMPKRKKPIFLRVNLQNEINDGDSYQIASVIRAIGIKQRSKNDGA